MSARPDPARAGISPSLSRRRFGALAGLVLAAPLLEACGTSSSPATGPAAATSKAPVPGGSLTYAVDTEPTSFDIHVSAQDITGEIQRNVFDSLIAQAPDGTFHPWLASAWEVSDDLKTYTFHLRGDVTFTDGTPFDGAAVKANFDRIANPATKSQLASSLLGPYTGTQVVDPHTVKVSFSQAFAPFLQAASTAYLGFYSPKALAGDTSSLAAGGPAAVGTGPFTFTSYTKGQSAVLTKNPAYNWAPATGGHAGAAYLDTLTIRFLSEDSVRVGALSSKQVQIAKGIPPTRLKGLQADNALSLVKHNDPGGVYTIFFNGSKAPLDDVNVRRAITAGVDVDLDVKTVYAGQYDRAWGPVSPVTPDYDPGVEKKISYDPARAGQLLDQAGWTGRDADGYRTKNGATLELDWPLLPAGYLREQRDVLGQAIQADLKKIGVKVNRPQPDIGTYVTTVYGGKAHLVDFTWARFEPDVLWLFFNSASAPAKGGQNATFIGDAQLDQWTAAGRATLDAATRKDLYAKVQERVLELALILPVYVPQTVTGVSSKVHGLAFDPNVWTLFHDVWIDR